MKCRKDGGMCGLGGYCIRCPALDMTKLQLFKEVAKDSIRGIFDRIIVLAWKIRGWL